MANAPVSIRDVAAYAGVSVGTVSNVLNRPGVVAEPTRSRVQAAIKQLGFIRNESARQLRAGGRGPRAAGRGTGRIRLAGSRAGVAVSAHGSLLSALLTRLPARPCRSRHSRLFGRSGAAHPGARCNVSNM